MGRGKELDVASAIYENILREVEQLTPEERYQLRNELSALVEEVPQPETPLVAFLRSMGPLDSDIADAMERAIEEDCERIDARNI